MAASNGPVSEKVRAARLSTAPRVTADDFRIEDGFARHERRTVHGGSCLAEAASRASTLHATGLLSVTQTGSHTGLNPSGGTDVGRALVHSFSDDTESFLGDADKLRTLAQRIAANKQRISDEWWRQQADLQHELIEHLIELGENSPPAWGTDFGDAVYAAFRHMHWPLCRAYFATCQSSLAAWRARSDEQRYMINFGTQSRLVDSNGCLGAAYDPATYVNVVLTSDSAQLVTLQAQGPRTPEQARRLGQAAQAVAAQRGIGRIAFVNLAAGQIPQFAAALPDGTFYGEFAGWTDGTLLEAPRTLSQWLAPIWQWIQAGPGRALVVFNCNAGIDRSGIANLLTQLVVDHGNSPLPPMERLDAALAQIKAGRPRAISTLARYRFARELYHDLLQG